MAAAVTLRIYSGLPNPVWELTPAQEEELLSRLEQLPLTQGEVSQGSPGLGYNGFVIQASRGPYFQQPVLVYKGLVQRAPELYQDTQRQLEKWLLNTAGSSIPEHLKEVIEREVKQP